MSIEEVPGQEAGGWYKKWWGAILIGLGILAVAGGVIYSVLVARYWWEIRQGRGEALAQKIYGNFSSMTTRTSTMPGAINRSDIETAVDDPFLGSAEAPVVIVEFMDFKCPNSKAAAPILRQVMQKYGQKVKLIIRDFPEESLHPGATRLAEIANCAFRQGLYWPTHDWLFEQQDNLPKNLTSDDLKTLAQYIGLDYGRLQSCLALSESKVEVNRDYADAISFGVRGTPTFFVNGSRVEGVVPLEVWDKFLSGIK